jgi:hypothetical protein
VDILLDFAVTCRLPPEYEGLIAEQASVRCGTRVASVICVNHRDRKKGVTRSNVKQGKTVARAFYAFLLMAVAVLVMTAYIVLFS